MSDEIVRRLHNRSQRDRDFLKESLNKFKISEAEDEDEKDEGPDIDIEAAKEEIYPPEDEEFEDTPDIPEDEETPEEETEEEPVEEEPKKSKDQDNANPLDNAYAVNHKIGDEVVMTFTNGTQSFMKGFVEGYDKEGFYRIKWEDGMTTNGFTDLALADMVQDTSENKCVCGNEEFVTEGKYVVCDKCGRRIREALIKEDEVDVTIERGEPFTNATIINKLRAAGHNVSNIEWEIKSNGYGRGFRDYIVTAGNDTYNLRVFRESTDPLTKADKSRPAGKKMIRSMATPVSTAAKPDISEAIKRAFKSSAPLNEDYDDDYEDEDEDEETDDIFVPLNRLKGDFWTRRDELKDDIEDLGFIVEEINGEYVVISAEDEDTSYALQVPIAGTSRTMTLDLDRARKV